MAARPGIAGVALQHDLLMRLPGHKTIRTVGEGRPVVRGAQEVLPREPMLGENREHEGHRAERVRRPEPHPEFLVPDDPDRDQVVEERLEEAGRDLGVHDLPDRERRIPGGHGPAVLPHGVRADRERVLQPVGRDLPFFGQARDQMHRGVDVEQVALDVREHVGFGGARLEHGVQRGGLAGEAAAQDAPVDRRFPGLVQEADRQRRRSNGRRCRDGRGGRTGRSALLAGAAGSPEERRQDSGPRDRAPHVFNLRRIIP